LQQSSTEGYINMTGSGGLNFRMGSGFDTRMTIDSSGNLGVGTTTIPAWNGAIGRKFAFAGPNTNTNAVISLQSGATASDGGAIYEAYSTNTTSGSVALGSIAFLRENTSTTALSSYTAFYTNNAGAVAERMRIDSSGTVLVGATDPDNTASTGARMYSNGSIASTRSETTDGAGTSLVVYSTGAAANRFYVGMGGTVYATNTSITAISDATLKENVRDLDKGLDTVLALKPRRFDWKNGDGDDIMGFIAQEVEEVMPELVHDYKYNEDETKKALKMGDMIPSMVKAIQEQQAMIEELKAEVAALKGA